MAASYPASLPSFDVKADGVDYVLAAHMNDVQSEIVALATELGINVAGDQTDLLTRLAVSINDNGTIKLSALAAHTGISDDNLVEVDGSPNSAEMAVWTAAGLDGKTYAELIALWRSAGVIGIDDNDILEVDGVLAANDILIATAAGVLGKTTAEFIAILRTDGLIGIGDNDILEVDGTLNVNEFAFSTAAGLYGKSAAEVVAIIDGAADWDFDDHDLHNMKQVDFQDTHANGNSGANKTINWNNCNIQSVKLTANCTFAFTAPAGPCGLTLYLLGDGSVRTTAYPGSADWLDDGEPGAWGATNNEIVGVVSLRYDAAMTPNYIMTGKERT